MDDSIAFLNVADELIAATPGFHVAGRAASGDQALALAQHLQPDLVLVDVRMPGMDGVETARRLAVICPEAVVVLISSAESPDLPSSVEASGAAAFMRKQDLKSATLHRLWEANAKSGAGPR